MNKQIKDILCPEEKILWLGRPSLKRFLTPVEMLLLFVNLIIFSLMAAIAINSKAYFISFIVIAVLLLGLWTCFIYKYKQRRKILYILTSSRIIFLYEDEIVTKKYTEINESEIELVLKWENTGSIYLSSFPTYYFSGKIFAEIDRERSEVLAEIEGAEQVYALIKSKLQH